MGRLIVLIVALFLGTHVCAGDKPKELDVATAQPRIVVSDDRAVAVEEQLKSMLESLKGLEQDRTVLQQKLKKAQDEPGKKQINDDIARLSGRVNELHSSFEELASSGINLASFERMGEGAFDWKLELEDIVRPLFEEMKKLTERPRTVERLRGEQIQYEKRRLVSDRAMIGVSALVEKVASPDVKKELNDVLRRWSDRRDEADSRLQAIASQLDRLLQPSAEDKFDFTATLQSFFQGRGLSVMMALTGIVLTYGLLFVLGRQISQRIDRVQRFRGHVLRRVATLVVQAMSFSVSLFVAMVILYARSDWLLLGLLLIFIVALLWTLRQSAPRYMAEARVLLNMGSVREGERVTYDGLPWKITSLNIYSTLHNPLLRGGTVRLTIGDIAQLHSRPYTKDEPWFPCREGDFVILDGDIFGKVLMQTPELVQLQVIGSTTSFPVADFLAKHPRNLSQGFALPMVFGLDYQHQSLILTDVVEKLRGEFEASSVAEVFGRHRTGLLVEFNEAASSSLNILVVCVFDGEAAEHYWSIRRFMQRTAVSACNKYGWNIPFNQMTIHTDWRNPPALGVAHQTGPLAAEVLPIQGA